jgi:uncharacterized protein (TIGR03435 family)
MAGCTGYQLDDERSLRGEKKSPPGEHLNLVGGKVAVKTRAFAMAALFSLGHAFLLAQSTTAAASPKFDIADVHVSPHRAFVLGTDGYVRGDRYTFHQATLLNLIATAYHLDAAQVLGGPAWLESDRFDIVAKIPAGTRREALPRMLRSLLADRFQLQVHDESRDSSAFVLSAGKGPNKMSQSEDAPEADCKPLDSAHGSAAGSVRSIGFSCRHSTMEEFANNLHDWASGYLTDPVVDETKLKGTWDFDIRWTPKDLLQNAGPDGVSVFDAVDQQLGLKLERQTVARRVLMVDSVRETPTPNAPDVERILSNVAPPQFDVSTIKPAKPAKDTGFGLDGGNFEATNVRLRELIAFAWDFSMSDHEQLVGAPKWVDSDRYDFQAKLLDDTPASSAPNDLRIDAEDVRQMLQALIMERFKMRSHVEKRLVTAYTLRAVKPRLAKADPSSRRHCVEGPGRDGKDPRAANPLLNRLASCQNTTMAQFGAELEGIASGYIYGPVVDETGLKGSWDFTLSFSTADLIKAGEGGDGGALGGQAASNSSASDPNGAVSLFDAVSKQLGLKLEKQRRLAPVLVIDHIEKASAN